MFSLSLSLSRVEKGSEPGLLSLALQIGLHPRRVNFEFSQDTVLACVTTDS
jgi:hypothetical protein